MPLKLKLAAHERLIVNGAVMVNGGCRTTLVIGNFAHIMREKDVLQERDANTPTKRLYLILQTMLMQPPPSEAVTASYRLAHSQLTAAYERPENLTILAEVARMVEFGARSPRFLEVIQDRIEGSQSYLKLAAKLHIGLAAALWDIGPLRQMFASGPRADL